MLSYWCVTVLLEYENLKNQRSFDDLRNHWLPEVKANADAGVKKILLINKADLQNREVDFSEAKSWAELEGIDAYETSAKSGKNVNQAFTDLCRYLMSINSHGSRAMGNDSTLTRYGHEQGGENKDSSCC